MAKVLSKFYHFMMEKDIVFIMVQITFMIDWMIFFGLTKGDTYSKVAYLLIGFAGFIAFYDNLKHPKEIHNRREESILFGATILFSMWILLANYKIYLPYVDSQVKPLLLRGIIFWGSFFLWSHLLVFFFERLRGFEWKQKEARNAAFDVFLIFFILLLCLYMFLFFVSCYPGCVWSDSINQLEQIMRNEFTNHHSYYHTSLVKFFYDIGMDLWGNINAAIALYQCFQMIVVAFVFAYCLTTMYQAKAPYWLIIVSLLGYLLLPCHIFSSFNMWKDTLFGVMFLCFLVALFRMVKGVEGLPIGQAIVLLISGICVCLFRSNGMFTFIISTIVFVFAFHKENRKICFILCEIIVVSFILKRPILALLKVPQPPIIESLSIPIQQIARVVEDEKELSETDKKLLNCFMDVQRAKAVYSPWLSDWVKGSMKMDYLEDNMPLFFCLWVHIGISHPIEYFRAWVDQTIGFWNPVDEYMRVCYNDVYQMHGIKRSVKNESIKSFLDKYLAIFSVNPFLKATYNIGFLVWILLVCFFANLVWKRKNAVFIVPELAIVLSLMIATPVSAEFRYAYCVVTSFPFLIFIAFVNFHHESKTNLLQEEEKKNHHEITITKNSYQNGLESHSVEH